MRVAAVRTNHDTSPFDDRHAILSVTANSDDCVILDKYFIDSEAFADLGTGPRRSVDQDLVEHDAARRICSGESIDGTWCAPDRNRSEVE